METEAEVSSLMDTWIAVVYNLEEETRHREIYIVKSRGMEHSQEIRRLVMTSEGLEIQNVP